MVVILLVLEALLVNGFVSRAQAPDTLAREDSSLDSIDIRISHVTYPVDAHFAVSKTDLKQNFLFNNAYIYASKEQRETMNKGPYYRQSAIVFSILCVVFVVIGLSVLLQNSKIMLLEIPLFIGVIIYAIISTIKYNNHVKDGE